MTLSVTPQASPLAQKIVKDTNVVSVPIVNVTGAPCLLYNIDIDNSLNPTQIIYFKIYDDGSPTVGTTPPDFIVKIEGGDRRSIVIPEGVNINTALTYCCTTQGGTVGTVAPSNPVTVMMVTS